MERKYYLRGLGLGILMTAVIMGVALSGRKAMTDDEIIAQAKELGMVENTVLSETQEDMEEASGAEDMAAAGQETDAADAAAQSGDPKAADVTEPEGGTEDGAPTEDNGENGAEGAETPRDDETPEIEAGETVPGDQYATPGAPQDAEQIPDASQELPDVPAGEDRVITINSGDGSYTVAKKLAAAGVVTSAENFDTFLCANGYDKKLRTGDFTIPADAGDEQIARIVTGAE